MSPSPFQPLDKQSQLTLLGGVRLWISSNGLRPAVSCPGGPIKRAFMSSSPQLPPVPLKPLVWSIAEKGQPPTVTVK